MSRYTSSDLGPDVTTVRFCSSWTHIRSPHVHYWSRRSTSAVTSGKLSELLRRSGVKTFAITFVFGGKHQARLPDSQTGRVGTGCCHRR